MRYNGFLCSVVTRRLSLGFAGICLFFGCKQNFEKPFTAFTVYDSLSVAAQADTLNLYISTDGYIFDTTRITWIDAIRRDSVCLKMRIIGERYPEDNRLFYLKRDTTANVVVKVVIADTLQDGPPIHKTSSLPKSVANPRATSYCLLDSIEISRHPEMEIAVYWGQTADTVAQQLY